MILSKYNFLLKLKDSEEYIIYNALVNSLAIISMEEYSQIIKNKISESLYNQLHKLGFAVESHEYELNQIKERIDKSRHSNDSLNLTIAVTSNCNFRCSYCYEKNQIKRLYMKEDIEEELINFVKKNYNQKKIKSLNITWYGGEPLLNFGSITRLSNAFIHFCEKNNITYNAGIITNGYLLTNKILKKMCDFKITSIQVTLDGNKEIHDKRRYLINGLGTFDTILKNLMNNYDVYSSLFLRGDIDKENIQYYTEVILNR